MQTDILPQSIIHMSSNHVTTLQINTLRLDSTHPATYNLVGFSGCSHLWWIPLLTPELFTPKLCVTSVTNVAMNQFPHTQGWPLMNFRPPATPITGVNPL